jgi:hypothetical protein
LSDASNATLTLVLSKVKDLLYNEFQCESFEYTILFLRRFTSNILLVVFVVGKDTAINRLDLNKKLLEKINLRGLNGAHHYFFVYFHYVVRNNERSNFFFFNIKCNSDDISVKTMLY